MKKLICPKCHETLTQINNTMQCINHHNYDIAKQKYINLLLNPDKSTNNPGDSKKSLQARRLFLNQGYYDPIYMSFLKYLENKEIILDLGCGEGYYTYQMSLNHPGEYYGLDISKEAIRMATRYTKEITWIVGNSKNIPVSDHSIDVVTALFTVVNSKELKRVVKKNGLIIHVTANPYHLVEIKEKIYDEIKIKSDKYIRLPFTTLESFDIKKEIPIKSQEDALNLLKMTPHYYHIKKEDRDMIPEFTLDHITIDVKVTIYVSDE